MKGIYAEMTSSDNIAKMDAQTLEVVKMTNDYGENSSTHKKVRIVMIKEVHKQLVQYLSERKVKHSNFKVGDIACADGRNSLDLYEMLQMDVNRGTNRLDSYQPLIRWIRELAHNWNLCLSDLNDHSEAVQRYFQGDPKVTFQKEANFYQQIYSNESMDIIVSSIAMHWLPKEMDWSGDMNAIHPGLTEKEIAERRQFAKEIFSDVITARAKELKPGGILILANPCEHGTYSPLDLNPDGQQKMLRLMRKLAVEEFGIDLQVNCYFRTKDDYEEPFLENPQTWSKVQSRNIEIGCAYYEKYLQDSETLERKEEASDKFSQAMVASIRAWSISRLKRAFIDAGYTDEKLNRALKEYYQKLEEAMRNNPDECHQDYNVNLLVAHRSK